jgi:hypothetical protein
LTERSPNGFIANVPTVPGNSDKPVSRSTEGSANTFTSVTANVSIGNSDTVMALLPDKPISRSMEESMNAFTANAPVPNVTGNSDATLLPDKPVSQLMEGSVGGKKPSKMRPGNTLTPRWSVF